MRQPLSVVIITFNEERNIRRCLASAQAIADEIVVVDSFSTDQTKSICAEYGVRFIEHSFKGHIEQKNWARKQASHELVLSLDADEALTPILQQSIQEVKENATSSGYKMNRLTNYCGTWIKHCGWYPDKKLRLWNNKKGKWTGENPHDEFTLFDTSENVLHLKGDLLHYSYYTEEDHDKQIAYFTDIAAKAHVKNNKGSYFLKPQLSAITKFIKCLIIKTGFLDGKAGWRISVKSAYAAYLKYKKIGNLLKQKK